MSDANNHPSNKETKIDLHQQANQIAPSGKMTGVEIKGPITHVTINGAAIEIEGLEPEAGDPPYKGLFHFEQSDTHLFFGREDLTKTIIERLDTTNFLAVVGVSGSGKSSLVYAGVIPVLTGEVTLKGVAPPLGEWQIKTFSPTADPIRQLVFTLSPDDPRQQVNLATAITEDATATYQFIDTVINPTKYNPLLLFVDQFEEIFTLCKSEEKRQAFINHLLAIKDHPHVKIIIALRADFYGACLVYEPLRLLLKEHQELLGPMGRKELRDIIEKPAAHGNWKLVDGLVDTMLEDVGNEPGALPLLSHALRETWERRRGRYLPLSGYRDAGGVRGAIAETAEATFNSLTPTQQKLAKRLFLELTQLQNEGQDTRRRITLSQLPISAPEKADVKTVLELLAQARLITAGVSANQHSVSETGQQEGVSATAEKTYEVAHEALIREWTRLRTWLAENRESLVVQRQIINTTEEWIAHDYHDDYLYPEARLAPAEIWLKTAEGLFEHPESLQFLKKSREAIIAKQDAALKSTQHLAQARKRTLLALGLVVLVLFSFGLIFFVPIMQEKKAKEEARQELATLSNGNFVFHLSGELGGDPLVGWNDQLPQFFIEKYEVTNYQYRLCVDHGDCSAPANTDFLNDSLLNYPVHSVTALQAAVYCHWIGRRLPTEREWVRAAGGTAGYKWPWGDTPEPTSEYANFWADEIPFEEIRLYPVGRYPLDTTQQGEIYDMAGNVSEWTATYYVEAKPDAKTIGEDWDGEYSSLKTDATLVFRGGNYTASSRLSNWVRLQAVAQQPFHFIGFRCASSSPE